MATTQMTAREIMTGGAECVGMDDTLVDAARAMRDLGVGALPICGEDDRLHGIITDRDIAIRCVAEGADPAAVRVGDLAQGKPVTIGADASPDEALHTMVDADVRRLPVIDGQRLVGMISQADLAKHLPEHQVGQLVGAISADPPNN